MHDIYRNTLTWYRNTAHSDRLGFVIQSLYPERFDMRNIAKEWPLRIEHFERFRIATGLDKKEEKIQVNTLVSHLGRKAEKIFKSFNLTQADADKYDSVKQKFQNHFVRQRNVIYVRRSSLQSARPAQR